MKLYEIDAAIAEIIDPETGEISDLERLGELQMEREAKIEGVALAVKNLRADVADLREEEKALAERRRQKERKIENLLGWIDYALQGEKFETAKVEIGFTRSKALSITDETALMEWLMRSDYDCLDYKEPAIKKDAVKQLIKAGKKVPGCEIVENHSVKIK